jgi:hypothetical protein
MALKPENFCPLDAHGTLRVETPSGRSLDLVANGETLRLELPGLRDARSALPRSFTGRIRTVRLLAELLSTHGLTLSIESAARPLCRLGYNTKCSWLARMLRLGATDLSVSAIRRIFRNPT